MGDEVSEVQAAAFWQRLAEQMQLEEDRGDTYSVASLQAAAREAGIPEHIIESAASVLHKPVLSGSKRFEQQLFREYDYWTANGVRGGRVTEGLDVTIPAYTFCMNLDFTVTCDEDLCVSVFGEINSYSVGLPSTLNRFRGDPSEVFAIQVGYTKPNALLRMFGSRPERYVSMQSSSYRGLGDLSLDSFINITTQRKSFGEEYARIVQGAVKRVMPVLTRFREEHEKTIG
jgi:hypothetical protein